MAGEGKFGAGLETNALFRSRTQASIPWRRRMTRSAWNPQ
jgi:hypothetical protein